MCLEWNIIDRKCEKFHKNGLIIQNFLKKILFRIEKKTRKAIKLHNLSLNKIILILMSGLLIL